MMNSSIDSYLSHSKNNTYRVPVCFLPGVLYNKTMSTMQARRGFTIVELLIVIVVIAILAAITIVAYNGI